MGREFLIDTHCHLDFNQFDGDRSNVIRRANESGVQRIIVPAIDLESCHRILELAETYEAVFAAVGVHPNSSADWKEKWVEEIRSVAQHEKVVAIGEIGLDYYRNRASRNIQVTALSAQLSLAAEMGLPVILHNRQADDDLLNVLRDWLKEHQTWAIQARPGVFHSFLTTWQTAEQALSLGFYLGFTGPITYKKSDEVRDVASRVWSERYLIETDAPFLAPQSVRGKRNEPAYVRYVAEQIAETRAYDFEQVAQESSQNALRLFGPRLQV